MVALDMNLKDNGKYGHAELQPNTRPGPFWLLFQASIIGHMLHIQVLAKPNTVI